MRVLMFGWEFPPVHQRWAGRGVRGPGARAPGDRDGDRARPSPSPAASSARGPADPPRRNGRPAPASEPRARRATRAGVRAQAPARARRLLRPYLTEEALRGGDRDARRRPSPQRRADDLRSGSPRRGPALCRRSGAHRGPRVLRRHPRPRLDDLPGRHRGAAGVAESRSSSTSTPPSSTVRGRRERLRHGDRAARPRGGRPRRGGLRATPPRSLASRYGVPAERLRVVHNAIDPRETVGALVGGGDAIRSCSSPAASRGRRAPSTSWTRRRASPRRCPAVQVRRRGLRRPDAGDDARVASHGLEEPVPLHGVPASGRARPPLRPRRPLRHAVGLRALRVDGARGAPAGNAGHRVALGGRLRGHPQRAARRLRGRRGSRLQDPRRAALPSAARRALLGRPRGGAAALLARGGGRSASACIGNWWQNPRPAS